MLRGRSLSRATGPFQSLPPAKIRALHAAVLRFAATLAVAIYWKSALCLRPDVIEVTHGPATTADRGWLDCREPRD